MGLRRILLFDSSKPSTAFEAPVLRCFPGLLLPLLLLEWLEPSLLLTDRWWPGFFISFMICRVSQAFNGSPSSRTAFKAATSSSLFLVSPLDCDFRRGWRLDLRLLSELKLRLLPLFPLEVSSPSQLFFILPNVSFNAWSWEELLRLLSPDELLSSLRAFLYLLPAGVGNWSSPADRNTGSVSLANISWPLLISSLRSTSSFRQSSASQITTKRLGGQTSKQKVFFLISIWDIPSGISSLDVVLTKSCNQPSVVPRSKASRHAGFSPRASFTNPVRWFAPLAIRTLLPNPGPDWTHWLLQWTFQKPA